jgi:hypothetical protein
MQFHVPGQRKGMSMLSVMAGYAYSEQFVNSTTSLELSLSERSSVSWKLRSFVHDQTLISA